jgi:hypothetical protein
VWNSEPIIPTALGIIADWTAVEIPLITQILPNGSHLEDGLLPLQHHQISRLRSDARHAGVPVLETERTILTPGKRDGDTDTSAYND